MLSAADVPRVAALIGDPARAAGIARSTASDDLARLLGAALAAELLHRGWLRRLPGSRAVALPRPREDGLDAAFGLLAPLRGVGAATVR